MKLYVFDVEADGLLDVATKIHVMVWGNKKGLTTTHSYQEMREFLQQEDLVLVGHNIIRFDIPLLEKILGIQIKAKLVDSLALSWYLEPKRDLHGLEWWGEEFGIPKPAIDDWENLTPEEYAHRCQEDVKINLRLWNKFWRHLNKLYDDEEGVWRLIDYLTFKMDCAKEQERSRWKLDVPKVEGLLNQLQSEAEAKLDILSQAMPKIPIVAVRNKPKQMFLKNKIATLSKRGEAWYELLSTLGLPTHTEGPVEEITGYKEPNPNSHTQIKNWLYSIGWEPISFEYKRDKDTNEVRKIPQVKNKQDDSGGICPSIKELYEREPALEVLDGLSILNHRIGILKGFLENVDQEGYVKAQVKGFTNTLRFRHAVVVNLPGVDKPYGADIRSCLIAPDGYELVGSDLSSLEDRTKQHYMWKYDPTYVKEMMQPGYDPHLSLALFDGALTEQQVQDHKDKKASYKPIRHIYKQVNYALVRACKTV